MGAYTITISGRRLTSSINEAVVHFLRATDYDVVSTTAGLAAVGALVVLLVQREVVRAFGGERARRWIHGLDIAVLPLVLSLAIIVALRLLDLVPRNAFS
jgi:hypothetical protein